MENRTIDCSFYKTKEKAEKALASKQYDKTRHTVVIQEMEHHWAIIPKKYAGEKSDFIQA
jgi:hypothetical protein